MTVNPDRKAAISARMRDYGERHAEAARHLRELQELTTAEAIVHAADSWQLHVVAPGGTAVLQRIAVQVPGNAAPDHIHADRALAAARWMHTDMWTGDTLVDGERITLRRAATPAAARAYLEYTFEVVEDAGKPCRCSGRDRGACLHGQLDTSEEEWCGGRWIHVDREPAGVLGCTLWVDRYVCDTCDVDHYVEVRVPAAPWGERDAEGSMILYEGLYHPQLRGRANTADEPLKPFFA